MNQEFEKYIELYKQYQINLSEYKNELPSSDILHNGLVNISDEQLLQLYNTIINLTFIKNKLLLLDLENYVPDNNELITKNDFISYVVQLFKFYNNLFMECYEDNIWIIHDQTSKKYPLKENELVFENSISFVNDSSDDKAEYYIKLIRNHLNKLSSKIHVSTKIIEDSDNEICWMLLKCTSDIFYK
jgi:hypothetical protein